MRGDLSRDARGIVETEPVAPDQRERDGRNVEHKTFGGRRDRAGIQRVFADVLAVVDTRDTTRSDLCSSMPVKAMCTESVGVPLTKLKPFGA